MTGNSPASALERAWAGVQGIKLGVFIIVLFIDAWMWFMCYPLR
jgi:hypothetical protein